MDIKTIISLSVGIVLLGIIIYCWFSKKNFLTYNSIFKPIINLLYQVVTGLSGMIPNLNSLKNLIQCIEAAITATSLAESLWKSGEIAKEDKNQYAKEYINTLLISSNIELNTTINNIINGTIDFVCYLLPHEEK